MTRIAKMRPARAMESEGSNHMSHMRVSALPQRFDGRDATDSGRAVWNQEVVQPGATRTGLVGEVPEYRHRDDGDTPQRCCGKPHETLHHRANLPGPVRIRTSRVLSTSRDRAERLDCAQTLRRCWVSARASVVEDTCGVSPASDEPARRSLRTSTQKLG